MRHSEELPLDPEVAADLEVIDATLAGQIVDPIHTELVELTLFLAAERRPAPEEVARRLDARVKAGFSPHGTVPHARRRIFLRSALGGGVAAFTAAVAAVAVLTSGSPRVASEVLASPGAAAAGHGPALTSRTPVAAAGGTRDAKSLAANGVTAGGTSVTSAPSSGAGSSGAGSSGAGSSGAGSSGAGSSGAGANGAGASGAATNGAGARTSAPSLPATSAFATPSVPTPATNGRRIVQSADLQLTAQNNRVSNVAQEVFDVVGQLNGIVASSSVTAATGQQSYASISLSIPSGNLQQALTRLSELPYARVAARTDGTQDVNNEYLADVRRLQDARALRTQLLKQLASAYTQAQIDSIEAQIHDAEASISSDEATLNSLRHRISFSSLTVEINAAPVYVPVVKPHTGSGFTLGGAAHDSLRVLTVAAGVALIVLAALVPFTLLGALAAWIGYWVRRRRREHALDAA